MNKGIIPRYDDCKMRLEQARALMIATSSAESLDSLDPAVMASAMLGIEALVGEAERELDRMLDAVRVGEVLE